jgi:addiction module RelE/StbE family toxin
MVWMTYCMGEIFEHRRVTKRLNRLPQEVLKRYEKWKDIVDISGPSGLRLIKGFHDEQLHGEWKGHRSSRLGDQYRVIYRVEEHRVLVLVMDVTALDYRRQ